MHVLSLILELFLELASFGRILINAMTADILVGSLEYSHKHMINNLYVSGVIRHINFMLGFTSCSARNSRNSAANIRPPRGRPWVAFEDCQLIA
jgi:hypothetical protein